MLPPRLFPVAATLGLLFAAAPAAAADVIGDDDVPTLTASYGSRSAAKLRLAALAPQNYRVLRRPSASTIVIGYPNETRRVRRGDRVLVVPVAPCARTTLRLRTVADERDALTWVRENTPATLAFETVLTATVPTPTAALETRIVGATRQFAGIINDAILTERVVAAARLRSGRLAVLSQTSRTVDLAKRPGTACGGSGSFTVGKAFAEIRTGLAAAVTRTR